MHSSTSNFERGTLPAHGNRLEDRHIRRATIALLLLLLTTLLTVELGARLLFPRISHIQQRIQADEREVKALANTSPTDPPTVLLVGNSLLLHGLDYSRMQSELAPNARAVRYVIENTDYLDWYYGLRRLFSQGVRPSRVVLCLSLGQTLSPGILGEYSARHLFRGRDLLAVAHDTHLTTTQTSNLVFAHYSAFYAGRAEIRNYIMNVTFPGYANTLHKLARIPAVIPSEPEVIAQSRSRLRAIQELCQQNGVDFVFVVPPALNKEDELLLTAGNLEHVDVDVPVALGSLGKEYFRDSFHLNERGAAIFTEALARDVKSRLQSSAHYTTASTVPASRPTAETNSVASGVR